MNRIVLLIAFTVLALATLWHFFNSDPNRPTPSAEADVPAFIGRAAAARPVAEAFSQPVQQHPFLARAGVNSMHNDSGQRDHYYWAGPLGRDMRVQSRQFHRLAGSCVAQSFTSSGHMVGTCVSPFGVSLVARDPASLDVLARREITRWLPIGQKFSGGVYFHLDHRDRVLLATNGPEIQLWALVGEEGDFSWELDNVIAIADLLDSARPEQHQVIDVMPDWQGNYWFITRGGLVGVVAPDGTGGAAIALGGAEAEGIDNALAVGEHGVFVVSDHAMYRFRRGARGAVRLQWRTAYDRGSAAKPGTMGFGSGTTPTLVGNDYVAITDNADGRVNVMVYGQQDGRVVCKTPVFPSGRGASENSMAVVGRGLIVENNYGYSGPRNIPRSEPGLARVDIRADGTGCDLAWENLDIASPSAVPKVSLATGLVYVYTRDESNPDDLHAWYFTAVDVRTGEVVFKQLTGVGWLFNNHYGSISIAPDGTAYVGMMGGLVSLRDGP
ncbi:MAG: hypothetical protein R3228_12025 [Halioglobus sp.]|nr:hypothetical protein [Halioglobus sp.]